MTLLPKLFTLKEEDIMNNLRKKFIALTMAGVMMCAPCTVFATSTGDGVVIASGNSTNISPSSATITGDESEIIGTVQTDIVKVVLPTADTTNNTLSALKFTLDPQLLIAKAGVSDITIAQGSESATVLFESGTASGNYSDTSDKIPVINKGTVPVKIKLTPSVTTTGSLGVVNGLASGNVWSSGNAEIALTMTDDEDEKTAILSDGSDDQEFELDAAPEDAYTVTASGNATNGYTFSYDPTPGYDEANFDQKYFTISGTTNPSSSIDWTTYSSATAKISLAWDISLGTVLSGNKPTFESTTAGTINVTAGDGDYATISVDKVIATIDSTDYDLADYSLNTSNLANGSITFSATKLYKAASYASTTADVKITYTANSKQFTSKITVPLQ